MARSTFSLDGELAATLEALPEKVTENALELRSVIDEGSWGVSPDLSYRFADSLLVVSAKPTLSNVLRQAAECYSAVATEILRAGQLSVGYAQLAVDSDMSKMRAAMHDRNFERWASLKD